MKNDNHAPKGHVYQVHGKIPPPALALDVLWEQVEFLGKHLEGTDLFSPRVAKALTDIRLSAYVLFSHTQRSGQGPDASSR